MRTIAPALPTLDSNTERSGSFDVRRDLLAASMLCSAILFVAAQGLDLHLGSAAAAAIREATPHRSRLLASVYCDMLGSAAFVGLAAGLMRLVRAGRGAAWITVGGVLLMVGGISNALGGAVFGYDIYFGTAAGVSAAAGTARAEEIGGRLEFDQATPTGTRVTATLPLGPGAMSEYRSEAKVAGSNEVGVSAVVHPTRVHQ